MTPDELTRAHRRLRSFETRRAILTSLRGRPDRIGTADDITPMDFVHHGNGGHIGSAYRSLQTLELIEQVGHASAVRPSCHGREFKKWRLVNDRAADAYVNTLGGQIEELKNTLGLN